MGIIVKDYTVTGDRSSNTVSVLYDTGAGSSFVRRDVAENLGTIVHTLRSITFAMADGRGTFTVDQDVALYIDVDGAPLLYHFFVVDDLAEELVVGADMMQRFKISLDMDDESVSIDPRALYLRA
jgi:hypothetical protein